MTKNYGFRFWFMWILAFAGSLTLSSVFWTALMQFLFGGISSTEESISWLFAVMGSWLLILVPYIRKKEQIWKRLNPDQEEAVNAWITMFSVLLFFFVLSMVVWTWHYRDIKKAEGLHPGWLKNVFLSWLAVLIPCLIWMYRKADVITRTAVKRHERRQKTYRTCYIPEKDRRLPAKLTKELADISPTIQNAHIVHLILRDGSKIENVFIQNRSEILGVYDKTSFAIKPSEIASIETLDRHKLPVYKEALWLRLDNR